MGDNVGGVGTGAVGEYRLAQSQALRPGWTQDCMTEFVSVYQRGSLGKQPD